MKYQRKVLIGLISLTALFVAMALTTATGSSAQGVNPGRDCQTITTCQFQKGGSYRGCLSSYSCRYCRYVASNCVIGGTRKRCHKSVCTWG
jgi:hypothetical protein